MTTYNVLVTGGAGFIGSFIVDALVKEGHAVTILDNLTEQVHQGKKPDYLNPEATFVQGDVLNYDEFKKEILKADVLFHEASAVGVGQSMYKIKHYTDTNVMGTANLLHVLANENHNLKKVVVAASMSSYGEGAYTCEDCGVAFPPLRSAEQMQKKEWKLQCDCDKSLTPIPTKETKPLNPNSIYAISKATQEQMVLTVGKAYGIPSVSLRYFNAYGPRQSLSNPYTGVAAIFMSRIKNNHQPVVYEDGMQTRDFVSVHDVAHANLLAMHSSAANYEMMNIGSGMPTTIKGVAEILAKIHNSNVLPQITETSRKGDVRHCFADMTKAKKLLDFETTVSFEDGMRELAQWSEKTEAVDKVDKATSELKSKGLGK